MFVVVSAAVVAVTSAVSFLALEELRVGGATYREIINGKDLVADILPPPEYVIEADLEATLLHDNPASLPQRRARLEQLHKDFNDRRAYWGKSTLPSNLKAGTERSAQAADGFWQAVEGRMLPALSAGDATAAAAAYADVQSAYAAHRKTVDALVDDANAFNGRVEAKAEGLKTLFMSLQLGAALAGLVLLLIGGALIIRRVVRPLVGMTGAMSRLAGGELHAEVPSRERLDEVGAMAAAVQVFKDAGLEKVRLEAEAEAARTQAEEDRAAREQAREQAAQAQALVVGALAGGLERLSAGDLTCAIGQPFSPEYEKLRRDFNAAVNKLQETVSVIAGATEGIRSGVKEISLATDELARRTEQQAAGLEETAAALDEITATVRKTASGSATARTTVLAARHQAEQSSVVVGQTVEAMSQIEQSSREIQQIIGVIDEIAFQTNLLALNAGVEAARAGEFGRGFAVVATEVRALSQRSAEAARDIKGLITSASTQVQGGVALVGQTGEALTRMLAGIGEITELVGEISASTQEQSVALSEVNSAVNQMDQATQQNAAMVEESAAASAALNDEAQGLAKLVSAFKLDDAQPSRGSVRGARLKVA